MGTVGNRSLVALAVVLAALAFAVAFFAARTLGSDSEAATAEPIEPLTAQPVPVNNLERAPTIKPLRSVAGDPPAGAPAPGAPAP
jgi:hypothetical protein